MTGYSGNIQELAMANGNFRQVLYTSKYMQLVLMSLLPGEEIGEEVHETVDQFFRIESGTVKVVMNGEETTITAEMVAIVPAGTRHNVINVGQTQVKLYTIYAPPNHPDGTINATKADAEAYEAAKHQQ